MGSPAAFLADVQDAFSHVGNGGAVEAPVTTGRLMLDQCIAVLVVGALVFFALVGFGRLRDPSGGRPFPLIRSVRGFLTSDIASGTNRVAVRYQPGPFRTCLRNL
jgi:hypothetical protein